VFQTSGEVNGGKVTLVNVSVTEPALNNLKLSPAFKASPVALTTSAPPRDNEPFTARKSFVKVEPVLLRFSAVVPRSKRLLLITSRPAFPVGETVPLIC